MQYGSSYCLPVQFADCSSILYSLCSPLSHTSTHLAVALTFNKCLSRDFNKHTSLSTLSFQKLELFGFSHLCFVFFVFLQHQNRRGDSAELQACVEKQAQVEAAVRAAFCGDSKLLTFTDCEEWQSFHLVLCQALMICSPSLSLSPLVSHVIFLLQCIFSPLILLRYVLLSMLLYMYKDKSHKIFLLVCTVNERI